MSRVVKNIIRVIGVFLIAVPIYLLFDLSGASPIYEPGIMATALSIIIGASLAIMIFNFSMISKAIEGLRQLDEASTYKERAINALKGSAKETKEDTFLILTGTMMIIISMMLKGTALPVQLLGNSILAEDAMCVIILGFLCHIIVAFFDIAVTFLKSFNMISFLKSN